MEKIFYLAQVVNGLSTVFTVFLIISSVISVILLIGYACEKSEGNKEADSLLKIVKKVLVVFIISLVGAVFVPSKETFLFMVGGSVVDQAMEHKPEIKELPENTLELLNEYIKTATDKVREEKK